MCKFLAKNAKNLNKKRKVKHANVIFNKQLEQQQRERRSLQFQPCQLTSY